MRHPDQPEPMDPLDHDVEFEIEIEFEVAPLDSRVEADGTVVRRFALTRALLALEPGPDTNDDDLNRLIEADVLGLEDAA